MVTPLVATRGVPSAHRSRTFFQPSWGCTVPRTPRANRGTYHPMYTLPESQTDCDTGRAQWVPRAMCRRSSYKCTSYTAYSQCRTFPACSIMLHSGAFSYSPWLHSTRIKMSYRDLARQKPTTALLYQGRPFMVQVECHNHTFNHLAALHTTLLPPDPHPL